MPCAASSTAAGGYTGLPMPFQISSVLVALDAITKASATPAFAAISFKINSAIGLRQMLPWQTNMILCIYTSKNISLFTNSIAQNDAFCIQIGEIFHFVERRLILPKCGGIMLKLFFNKN